MEKIRKELFELSEEEYKKFHSSLCPGTNNMIGIRVPILRQYAKKIVKQGEWKKILECNCIKYYEEIMLQGMIIGIAKMSIKETIGYLEKFIPKIDNWAVCDVVCAGLKITKKYPEDMWNFIINYIDSNNEFEVRFSVVMMLDFYLNEVYMEEVLKIIENITHSGYYVRMAIAWLISVAYVKFPKRIEKYLKETKLDDYTYNKALQKIIESTRVTKDNKEKIRQMKRKL